MDQIQQARLRAVGKTTKMLQLAKVKADEGNSVVVVMKTQADIDQWRDKTSPEITLETEAYLNTIGITVTPNLAKFSYIRAAKKCVLIDHSVLQ